MLRIRHIIKDLRFLKRAVVGIEVSGIGLSLFLGNWTWFSRFGALICIVGATMGVRGPIRLGLRGFYRHLSMFDGGNIVPTLAEKRKEDEIKQDIRATIDGYCVLIIGSLIWAFGDLVNHLVAWIPIL